MAPIVMYNPFISINKISHSKLNFELIFESMVEILQKIQNIFLFENIL